MNLIVGLLIGLVGNSWTWWILTPVFWAMAVTAYKSFNRKEEAVQLSSAKGTVRFGLSHIQAYYIIHFMTTLTATLVFSVIVGLAKVIFKF